MKKFSILAAMMVVMAGVALASTLNVPFFLDTSTDNASKVAGFIGVKNATNAPQTVTVIYTAVNSSNTPEDQTVTFFLGANEAVSFTPRTTNPAEDTAASAVPNMTIVGPGTVTAVNIAGSAKIIGSSAGSVVGRYSQINFTRSSDMAHVLLPTAL